MPVQTACCECGNSCLNRITTDFRSSLGVPTVDALMFIALNGPTPTDYNASRAVAKWFDPGERLRRPQRMDTDEQGLSIFLLISFIRLRKNIGTDDLGLSTR